MNCSVALVGDGGDEIFAGYPRHKATAYKKYFDYIPHPFAHLILSMLNRLPEDGRFGVLKRRARMFLESAKMPMADAFLNWSTYMDSRQIAKILPRTEAETPFFVQMKGIFERFRDDPIRAASLVDLSSFVPYNLLHGSDTTGMANSLEVRTPFLARELVELTLSISSRHKVSSARNKPILSDAISGLVPKTILKQPKRAFNPPLHGLLFNNAAWLERYLGGKSSALFSYLDFNEVQNELKHFKSRQKDNSTFLWGLVVLNAWLEKHGR